MNSYWHHLLVIIKSGWWWKGGKKKWYLYYVTRNSASKKAMVAVRTATFHWNCRENHPIQAPLCIRRGHRGTEFMNWRQQSRNKINQGVSTLFKNPGYLQGKDFPGGMGWEWGVKSMLWKGENSRLIKKEGGSQIWKPNAYGVCTLHAAGRGVANGKKDSVLCRGL